MVAASSNDSVVGMDSDIVALLERVADGDREAFATLYNKVSARLFGVVRRILPDGRVAEDALQETFLRIWQKASSYDSSVVPPMAWMATIAHNLAIDLKRRFAERL